jgi:thioredoxin-related protein
MNRVKLVIILIVFSFILFFGMAWGDSESVKKAPIYNPDSNTKQEIEKSVKKAALENKHILLMFGANWCPWCHRLHELFMSDPQIKKILTEKFIIILVDIGETKDKPLNRDIEEKFRLQGFGYPSLAVLDERGELLCTQNSGVLEKEKGHDPVRVLAFLKSESPEPIRK